MGKKDEGVEIETRYQLADHVYGRATIKSAQKVNLWLGAEVMLEYEVDEALDLIKGKLTSARESLATYNKDLAFLKDQITTTEVNLARVFNHDVQVRREAKLKA